MVVAHKPARAALGNEERPADGLDFDVSDQADARSRICIHLVVIQRPAHARAMSKGSLTPPSPPLKTSSTPRKPGFRSRFHPVGRALVRRI